MRRIHPRKWFVTVWGLIFAAAVCLLIKCLAAAGAHTDDTSTSLSFSVKTVIAGQAVRTLLPALTVGVTKGAALSDTISAEAFKASPLSTLAALCMLQWEPAAVCETGRQADSYTAESAVSDALLASAAGTASDAQTDASSDVSDSTAAEAASEIPADTTEVPTVDASPTPAADTQAADGTADMADAEAGAQLVQTSAGTILQHGTAAELAYTAAQLADFSFLLNNLYTLDSTTTIDASLLDGATLLAADMTLAKDVSVPQILIYHTHSQETFADSVEGDVSTSIVGVGDYLTTLLTDVYGYQVIHDRQTYDLIDGELDRNKAYTLALESISGILEENPTVQIVIDLHRDGIEGEKMTTTIGGKEIAKLMFFNGLSRTVKNGALESLANPYIQDNLAFSLQLKLAIERYYPGATRPVYLKGYRYNLHLRPRCLLVEAGSQKNTVQEEMNAMEVLADALDMVLRGEE